MPQENNAEHKAEKPDNSEKHSTGKRKSHVGLLLILLCVIVLFGGFSLIYLSANKPDEWTKFWIPNIVNVLLLIVIVIQVYVYAKQWESMNDALEETRLQTGIAQVTAIAAEASAKAAEQGTRIAQESAINAQRAYVMVRKATVDLRENESGKFLIEILNAGNTPARAIEVFAMAEARDAIPPIQVVDKVDSADWREAGVLPPRECMIRTVETSMPISPKQMKRMYDKELDFFAWGVIRYKDIFKETRYTWFCFVREYSTIKAGPCAVGNEVD